MSVILCSKVLFTKDILITPITFGDVEVKHTLFKLTGDAFPAIQDILRYLGSRDSIKVTEYHKLMQFFHVLFEQ